jgi:hypothetical protein
MPDHDTFTPRCVDQIVTHLEGAATATLFVVENHTFGDIMAYPVSLNDVRGTAELLKRAFREGDTEEVRYNPETGRTTTVPGQDGSISSREASAVANRLVDEFGQSPLIRNAVFSILNVAAPSDARSLSASLPSIDRTIDEFVVERLEAADSHPKSNGNGRIEEDEVKTAGGNPKRSRGVTNIGLKTAEAIADLGD